MKIISYPIDGNVSLNNKILSEVNDLLDEVLSKKKVSTI